MAAAAGAGAGAGAGSEARVREAREAREIAMQNIQQEEALRNRDRAQRQYQIQENIDRLTTQLRNPDLTQQQRVDITQELNRTRTALYQLDADSQHLFKVINDQIKQLIIYLKNEARNGGNLNQVVKATVESLEIMGNDVDEYAALEARNQEMLGRFDRGEKQLNPNITNAEISEILRARPNAASPLTTDVNGILTSTTSGRTINLEHLDTDQSNPTRLETDDQDDFADDAAIRNRLVNCQYLEILYLTKHDELMKIFRFTLILYKKYTYAINILLFVLKNLLDQRPCPQREPGEPGEPTQPGEPTRIKLPKALISNIKQLLKDQKQVQDVINRMKPIVENTLPNLVNEDTANEVSAPRIGSTIDDQNPE